MSLGEFQGFFWWEWLHRLIGRLVGGVFALPLAFFLLCRVAPPRSVFRLWAMPDRLIWRCVVLLALGGLQGLIGWWMVSSGLSERVSVAPERLATHLGLAFVLFAALIWTGLEAWNGEDHGRPPVGWARGAGLLLGLVFLQCLLGALVAGGHAGLVYTDWPLMNGQVLPPADWSLGAGAFLHDQALTQFNHRLIAYGLLLAVSIYALPGLALARGRRHGVAAFTLAGLIWAQALLGVITLMHAVPVWLGVLHQGGAALVLAAATANLWVVLRAQPRIFMSGPRAMGR